MNKDSRDRFQRWFFRALKPVLRKGGIIRVHGTVLHEDSLLAKLLKSKSWISRKFKAHESFDDFTNILWPQMWPEERLRAERQNFIDIGDASGYSQEYLNDPRDNSEAYLRKSDFVAMDEDDFKRNMNVGVGCDFAISKSDKANRTSFTVGGQTSDNDINVIDQRVGRWDSLEIIEEMFAIQKRHNPSIFFVEGGQIWKALEPILIREMRIRGVWINYQIFSPIKDKATRGRPLQARHRASSIKFNKDADWYPAYEEELLKFTGHSDAVLDDQFDSTATLCIGFNWLGEVQEEDFMDEEEQEMIEQDPRAAQGRSTVTGY